MRVGGESRLVCFWTGPTDEKDCEELLDCGLFSLSLSLRSTVG